jgi:hypothetical protein
VKRTRVITNRQLTNCAFCHEPIAIGEDCIQSQGVNYAYKWHFSCEPEARARRFGKNMNKAYVREILKEENRHLEIVEVTSDKHSVILTKEKDADYMKQVVNARERD